MKIMEMNYVAPELEVLEIMVEKGFEASASDPTTGGGGITLPDE